MGMNDVERWENEGGARRKPWSALTKVQKEGMIYRALNAYYPRLEYVEFDGSIFYKSLTPIDNHDIIEHDGRRYRVLYAWEWTHYGPIPVYMAELEPEEAQ